MCAGFLAYHGDALMNNSQFILGTTVDAFTVCASGRFQFHSHKKVGAGGGGGAFATTSFCVLKRMGKKRAK